MSKTLREQWLAGDDVVFDPCLDVALDAITGLVARMDIESRAAFCCLDDKQRLAFIWKALLRIRDGVEHRLLYGEGVPRG